MGGGGRLVVVGGGAGGGWGGMGRECAGADVRLTAGKDWNERSGVR